MTAARPVEPSDLRAYPTATPTREQEGQVGEQGVPAAASTAATGSSHSALAPEPVLAEHVVLAEPQQQRRGGQGGDGEHQRAADALQLARPGMPRFSVVSAVTVVMEHSSLGGPEVCWGAVWSGPVASRLV